MGIKRRIWHAIKQHAARLAPWEAALNAAKPGTRQHGLQLLTYREIFAELTDHELALRGLCDEQGLNFDTLLARAQP